MSITNLELINDALRDINVISEVDDASPEQGKYAIRKLNQMMELWKEMDINIGYFSQPDTTGNCPIPDWAELGVTASLSVVCASKYGRSISAELAAVASVSINMIKRKSISEMLENADMSHLPRGSGHFSSGYDITTDI